MLKGIVLAEYLQTRRHFLLVSLFIIVVALGLRYMSGNFGIVIGLLVVLPNICGLLGQGAFSEEFSKGQLRFLYSLPIHPFTLWGVKVVSGLFTCYFLAFLLCFILLFNPSAELNVMIIGFRQFLGASTGSLLLLFATYVLFSFSGGLLAVTMCVSLKSAGLVNTLIMYSPIALYWILFSKKGTVLAPGQLIPILAMASLILMAGALRMFFLRNPFDERPRILRWTGVAFIACASIVFAVSLGTSRPIADNFDQIIMAEPSPDGDFIAVVSRVGMSLRGYVLDSRGRICHDLGEGVHPLGVGEAIWSPPGGNLRLTYLRSDGSFMEEPSELNLFVLTIPGGQSKKLPYLSSMKYGTDHHYQYHTWSKDGNKLLGLADAEGPETFIFSQDVVTGAVKKEKMPKARYHFIGDGRVVSYSKEKELYTGFTVIEPFANRSRSFNLSQDTISCQVVPGRNTAVLLAKKINGDEVGFEVAAYDFETRISKILIPAPDLPKASLPDAIRGKLGAASVELSPDGQWVICTSASAEAGDGMIYVRITNGFTFKTPAEVALNRPQEFSPAGSAILRTVQTNPGTISPLELQIVKIDTQGVRKIYSQKPPPGAHRCKWLGNDKLIYIQMVPGQLQGNTELWVIDIAKKTSHRLQPAFPEQK